MDGRSIVPIPTDVTRHQRFNPLAMNVGTGKCARVEEDFLDNLRQPVPIPDAKVIELMPAKKHSL